jgi:Zn-finger nucleic acid-binding protein
MCGAPAQSDASACAHCGARLATMACPSCFGMIFQGSHFCPLCGGRADRVAGEASTLACPHCEEALTKVTVGKAILSECAKCEGLWVDTMSFEQICADREQQTAILGAAIVVPKGELSLKIRYIKCPECQMIMHRVNFAGSSGVVIDICKQHGAWFDAKELQRIVDFIRKGGLIQAREKQTARLEQARRDLESQKRETDRTNRHIEYQSEGYDIVQAAAEVLYRFLR